MRLVLLAMACVVAAPAAARAQERTSSTIHPIYAAIPGSAHNERAQRMFSEAVARYRIGPVEVMDIPAPPAAKAPALMKDGKAALDKLKLADAETMLDA